MSVTRSEVQHLAALARLSFDDQEEQRLLSDLNTMLEYVEKLQALDTTGVPPMAHVLDLHDVVRPDEVNQRINRDEVLQGAPDTDGRHFRVPKVIDS